MAACTRGCFSYSARKHLFLRCCFPKLYSTELATSKVNEGGKVEKEIVVPLRIKRGPTDILKALATTVNKDYTAAHYKYHDDPYFIPLSNPAKRNFSLAKDNGKDAARRFLREFPQFFKCNTSVPHVQAFDPPITYSEEDDLDEKTLENCIKSLDLSNSITVYNIMKNKGVSVSQGTKQKLLELVCFYNEIPPKDEDYAEIRWFTRKDRKPSEKWKVKGLAKELFNEIDKDSAAYCAMILGTAKCSDVKTAFELYEEMRRNNLLANLEVYNSLLTLVPWVEESGDQRWEFAMELISNMNREGLFPNLYTMNALLSIVSRSERWGKRRAIATQILAEMKRLDIEPSLGSYYHILKIFFHSNVAHPSVFHDILGKVDGKDLEIQHPDDLKFFVTAMGVCYKYLKRVDLAYRLLALLEKGQNCVLLGSSYNESVFYKNLTNLLCENEDFEKFMEFYNKYVPNVYTPQVDVMHAIVLAAELSGAYHHLPQIGSDLIVFIISEIEHLLSDFLRIAGSVKHPEEVQKPLVDVVWKIRELIDNRRSRRKENAFHWTGAMLGDIMKIFLHGEDLEKAKHVLLQLKKEEASIIGYPESDVLLQFCSAFLEAKDFVGVRVCVQYAVDSYYPEIRSDLRPVVEDLFKAEKLSEDDRSVVNPLLEIQESEENTAVQKDEICDENVSSSQN